MKNLVEFLKSISDETRLRILVLLAHREMCVCEICEVLGESQPKVSRHLARLRDAGYVKDDRQGQWVFYYTNLNNSVYEEIMESILKNRDEFSQFTMDINKLEEKASEGTFCSRKI